MGPGSAAGGRARFSAHSFLVYDAAPECAPVETQYEHRAWFSSVPASARLLHRTWRQQSAESRSDIYLLAPHRPLTLAKLRGGQRLEIKRFLRFKGALEEWAVRRCPLFPLGADELERFGRFIGAGGRGRWLNGRSPAHLLASLIEARAGVEPVIVSKQRLVFERNGCRAEIARVESERLRAFTMAVEAPSPGKALLAIDELGLGGRPNRSYAGALGNAHAAPRLPRLSSIRQPHSWRPASANQGAIHEEA